jgi:predicted RNA methylase
METLMRVEQNILEILERSRIDGAMLMLPPAQLDRATYTAVNKVIEAAGGRWDRKARAHVFAGLAIDTIEPILLTGEYTRTKQEFGQFDSPPTVVSRLLKLAEIKPGMAVLEPNAGLGNIAEGAEKAGGLVTAFEIDAARLHAAKDRCQFHGGIHLLDFLFVEPEPIFDRVVMNPPFAKQADIKHVLHAAAHLKPGGRLVSVMSASVTFRTDTRTEEFRNFINQRGAHHEKLPDGTFKEAGTMVNAVIVAFDM